MGNVVRRCRTWFGAPRPQQRAVASTSLVHHEHGQQMANGSIPRVRWEEPTRIRDHDRELAFFASGSRSPTVSGVGECSVGAALA